MNELLRSPWFPLTGANDRSFMPEGLAQAIFYPFYWLSGRQAVVAEISFRDARFAADYLAVIAVTLTVLHRRWPPPRAVVVLLVFFTIGYVLWEAAFSIIRYAVTLEALSGSVLMLGLTQLPRRREFVFGGAVIVFVLAFGNYADWGRIRLLGRTVFATPVQTLPPDSLVVITGAPRGFMTLFLHGPNIAFIGLAGMSPETQMWTEARRRIATHQGPIYLLNGADAAVPTLPDADLRQSALPCMPLPNPYQRGLELCQTERTGPG